jgi:Domain of unknown function (DUF4287)
MNTSSFQSYIDKIKLQTGRSIEEFAKYAKAKGFFKPEVKAGDIVDWLKKDFQLKHGDAVAMYGLFKHMGLITKPEKTSINIDKL